MPHIEFNRYYNYDELTTLLHAYAAEYPSLVKVESMGKSYEGRDIWTLTVTHFETGAAADKPALWIDGNIHATELSPSTACLYFLNYLVTNHGAEADVTRVLDTRAYYICPRLNPDGAEWAMENPPRPRRSSTRPYPYDEEPLPGLEEYDIDGDGRFLYMRLKDANGYWCMECHQIDLARKGKFKPGVTCPDCGKSFEPERMIDHAGKQLCKPCYSNRIHVDEDDEDDGGRGFGGKPRKKKRSYDSRSSGMDDTTKSRIKYGVVALFVLGLLSAWNFGVFDIGGDNPNSELNQLMGNVKFMLVFALGCIAVLVWWIKRQV